jgi:hypothetical protein
MIAWLKSHTANIILLILGVAVFVFTVVMIWLYMITGGIPDTLCTCFFVAVTGECGFMGWIKTQKIKNQERQWKLEDKIEEKEAVAVQRLSTLEALQEQGESYDSTRSKE